MKTMTEDARLLNAYTCEHSQGAFAELVRRHLGLVYSAALRRSNGNTHLAEEICQQVFTALAKDAGRLQGHSQLQGWLYVTTRHAAANLMRAEERRRARETEACIMQETNHGPAEDWERLRPQLDALMDELGEKDRDALLLRFFNDKPYAEISSALGLSEAAARMRVERALEKLRTLLARRGIRSTSTALASLLLSHGALAAPAGLASTITSSALASAASAAAATATTATATAAAGTGTAAGGVAALANITFMSTGKIIALSSVAAALAVGTAGYQYTQTQKAREQVAALEQEGGTLRKRVGELDGRLQTTEAELKQTREQLATTSAKSQTGSSAQSTSASRGTATGSQSIMDTLYSNPEYQKVSMLQYVAALPLRFGPLYRKLGFDASRIAEFERLLTEQQQIITDTMAAARAQGLSLNDPSLNKFNIPEAAALDAQLRTLLGEQGYADYKTFNQTSNSRRTAELLASQLYYTDTPLTAQQADSLAKIIQDSTPKTKITGMIGTAPEPDWQAILTKAEQTLHPAQLNTFKALQNKIKVEREYAELYQRLQREAAEAAVKARTQTGTPGS